MSAIKEYEHGLIEAEIEVLNLLADEQELYRTEMESEDAAV